MLLVQSLVSQNVCLMIRIQFPFMMQFMESNPGVHHDFLLEYLYWCFNLCKGGLPWRQDFGLVLCSANVVMLGIGNQDFWLVSHFVVVCPSLVCLWAPDSCPMLLAAGVCGAQPSSRSKLVFAGGAISVGCFLTSVCFLPFCGLGMQKNCRCRISA